MSQILYHLIPGYTLYDFQRTLTSGKPMAIKARDAVVSGTIAFTAFAIATEHALKIQAATGSAPGYLANRWQVLSRALPALATSLGIAGVGVAALVLYTGMNEPTRTDTSLRVRHQHSQHYHRSTGY
jgi:hypothetical protein